VKKLAAIAVAALVATGLATTAASAAPVTANGSVNVKWNVQVNATLALITNYTNLGVNSTTNSTIDVKNNGGIGTCAGPAATNVPGTVDFGNVTTDPTNVTFCGYENAVEAKVGTNSGNWNMSEAVAAAPTGGFLICPIGNGSEAGFPAVAPATAGLTPAAAFNAANQTAAFGATLACTATSLGGAPGLVVATTNVAATTGFTSGSAAAYIGEGYVLGVPANAAAGAQAIVVNYQVVAN